MRLATIRSPSGPRPALLLDSEVLDLEKAAEALADARGLPKSVLSLLEEGDVAITKVRRVCDALRSASESLREQLLSVGALHRLADVRLMAPLYNTRLVLAAGMNHRRHLQEMGMVAPSEPTAFVKSVNSLIGPREAIVLPAAHPDMVDWEVEFCAVIGRPCHNVSATQAAEYIGGYTLINDVSARNWVAPFNSLQGMYAIAAYERNLLGKQFPTFCPMGPVVVTKDEVRDPQSVNFRLTLNGEVMQSACTDDLVFDAAAIIAHYSRFYEFRPGDVITTGSPGGVGFARVPQRFLRDGDVVSIEADVIGGMQNRVVAERERHTTR